MSTELTTERDAFNAFIDQRFGSQQVDGISLEDALAEFRAYQRELLALKASLNKAEESSARGESKPLDVDDVIRRGRERLAAEGIID